MGWGKKLIGRKGWWGYSEGRSGGIRARMVCMMGKSHPAVGEGYIGRSILEEMESRMGYGKWGVMW